MNNILFFKSKKQVTIYLNGKHRSFEPENEEELKTIIKMVKEAKANPTENNIKILNNFISPSARFMDVPGIEKTRNGKYYIEGTNAEIPIELNKKLKEYIELDLDTQPLINFSKLLAINPVENVREDLFKFAEKYSFPITDNGLFVAYKSVQLKSPINIEIAKEISHKYIEVIGKREKPQNYIVVYHEDYPDDICIAKYSNASNDEDIQDIQDDLLEELAFTIFLKEDQDMQDELTDTKVATIKQQLKLKNLRNAFFNLATFVVEDKM